MKESKPIVKPLPLSSFGEVNRRVQGKWRNAKLCVIDGCNRVTEVRRMSMHIDRNGAMLILLHAETLETR